MVVEAIKKDDGYFIPIKGNKEKIKVFIEDDINIIDNKESIKDNWREIGMNTH